MNNMKKENPFVNNIATRILLDDCDYNIYIEGKDMIVHVTDYKDGPSHHYIYTFTKGKLVSQKEGNAHETLFRKE